MTSELEFDFNGYLAWHEAPTSGLHQPSEHASTSQALRANQIYKIKSLNLEIDVQLTGCVTTYELL